MKTCASFLSVTALLSGLLVPARATPVVEAGLQAYFAFDGNMSDQGSNAYALSVTGGAALTTDRFGAANGAVGFTNNVSYAAFGHSLANHSFSIGGWLFQDEYSPVTAGGFAQGNVGAPGQAFRLMTDYYDATVLFAFWFDDFTIHFDRDRSEWLHLFATFDNATLQRKLYINGELFAANVAAYGFSGTGDLWFGFMEGKMDEIRVYDRAISGAEVGLIHTSESTPSVPEGGTTVAYVALAGLGLLFQRRFRVYR